MALTYKGEWIQCPEYALDDVVKRGGEFYKALQQNAGKDPAVLENVDVYWAKLTDSEKKELAESDPLGGGTGLVLHNSTLEKDRTADAEATGVYVHIGQNEAYAMAFARNKPSADNPFATEADLPIFGKKLSPFVTMNTPENVGVIYGGTFDEPSGKLAVCGDGFVATYSPATNKWEVQILEGAWRAICRHNNAWIVVGTNCVASGEIGTLALGAIRAGRYNAIATSGGRVIAVGDGVSSWSDLGVASWQGIETSKGYGDGITYHETEGKFYAVGPSGCRTTSDGQIWAVDDTFSQDGTWRDIKRGEECLYAASGKIVVRDDRDKNWRVQESHTGGWNSIANGEGFSIAVANGRTVTSTGRYEPFEEADVPDYIYTAVVFGASRFWLLGSAIVSTLVENIAEALNAANAPNRDNPFVTLAEVNARTDESKAEILEEVNERLDEGELVWGGNVVGINGARFEGKIYDTENSMPAALEAGNLVAIKDKQKLMLIGINGEKIPLGSGAGGGEGYNPNKGTYFALSELQAAYPSANSGDYATVVDSNTSKLYVWSPTSLAWTDSGATGINVTSVNGKTPIQGNVQLAASDVGAAPAADTVQFDSHGNVNFTQGRGNNIILKHGKAYEGVLAGNEIVNVAKIDATGTRLGNTYVSTVIESNTRPTVELPNDETKELAYKDDVPEISSLYATPEEIEAGETEGKIVPWYYISEIAEKAESASQADVYTDSGSTAGDIVEGLSSLTVDMTLEQAQERFSVGDTIKLIKADGETAIATITDIQESDGKVYITTDTELGDSFNGSTIATTQAAIEYASTAKAGLIRLAEIPTD